MVTVEVDLKEDEEEPEQHLDDGEHIERVVVPISELYEKLQGEQCTLIPDVESSMRDGNISTQRFPKSLARLWMLGKLPILVFQEAIED